MCGKLMRKAGLKRRDSRRTAERYGSLVSQSSMSVQHGICEGGFCE